MSRDPAPEAERSLEYLTAALERIADALERAHPAPEDRPSPPDEPPLPTYPWGEKPQARRVIDPERPTPTVGDGARAELWAPGGDLFRPGGDLRVEVSGSEHVTLPYAVLATILLMADWSMTYPVRYPEEQSGG